MLPSSFHEHFAGLAWAAVAGTSIAPAASTVTAARCTARLFTFVTTHSLVRPSTTDNDGTLSLADAYDSVR